MELSVYLFHFALVSLVVALSTASIRLPDARLILSETVRFFLMIVVGLGIFAGVIWGLGRVFVR